MKRDYCLYVDDILEAIRRIETYTKGLNFEGFEQPNLIIDAVTNPEIPWRNMIDFRNILIHEYFGVDLSIVWVVATQNINDFKSYLEKLQKN